MASTRTTPSTTPFPYTMFLGDNLKEELKKDPELTKKRDEDGRTLLHVLATGQPLAVSCSLSRVQSILEAPGIDFNAKDYAGFTPLETALKYTAVNENVISILPLLIKRAAEQKDFDFNQLRNDGKALIHFAVLLQESVFRRHPFPQENLLSMFMKNAAEKIDVDVVTKSGSTAFYYAVNHGQTDNANTLLDHKASPDLTHDSSRNARTELKQLITELTKMVETHQTSLGKVSDEEKSKVYSSGLGFFENDRMKEIAKLKYRQKQLEQFKQLEARINAIPKPDARRCVIL